jgi:hypothetical protein
VALWTVLRVRRKPVECLTVVVTLLHPCENDVAPRRGMGLRLALDAEAVTLKKQTAYAQPPQGR